MTEFRGRCHHLNVETRRWSKKVIDFGDRNGQTVISILQLSPRHFISNIRHQHWCYQPGLCGINFIQCGVLCWDTLTLQWNFEIFRNKIVILNFLSFQSKNNFFNLSWDLTCRKWNWFSCNRGNIDRYSVSSFIKNDHYNHSKIIIKDFEKWKLDLKW